MECEAVERVEVTLAIDFENFQEVYRRLLVAAIAAFLDLPIDSVRIISVSKGSTKIVLELPQEAAERLAVAFEAADFLLTEYIGDFAALGLKRELTSQSGRKPGRERRRFNSIPARHFEEFHSAFQGDTPETFAVCAKCGGACEFNKIGTLMPGEREYMAAATGLSVAEFSERFLDVIQMEDGTELDVLRLINGCPFLNRGTFECNCRNYKVVLCEAYPIGFQVKEGRVQFMIDDWCPLADTLRFRRHFLEAGIAAVSRLPVPVEWYQYVERYDDLYFDFNALEAYRRDRMKLQTFALEELLRFQLTGLAIQPKLRFHPYPSEVLSPNTGAAPDG